MKEATPNPAPEVDLAKIRTAKVLVGIDHLKGTPSKTRPLRQKPLDMTEGVRTLDLSVLLLKAIFPAKRLPLALKI